MWLELLQIDDGRPTVVWEQCPAAESNSSTPRLGNWVRLAILLVVALFPLPWMWLNPTSGYDQQARPLPV
jgi:hypothetical protein